MYNASDFVEQCIQSAINQADIRKEIIVVDDGSTDNSAGIVESIFGNKVILFRKENGGASSARNVGLSLAQGKYIMFLDSDDWLEDNYICKNCINKIEKYNLQMCIFNYKYYNNNTQEYNEVTPINDELTQCQDVVEATNKMVSFGLFPASPCFRIIEREFLLKNKILFIENTTAEDIEWFTHVLVCIKRYGFLNNNAYVYRKNVSTSVTGSRGSIVKCKNLLNRICDAIEHTKNTNCKNYRNALLSALAYEYCILLGNISANKETKLLVKEAKKLSFLFNYKLFPKISYMSLIYKLLGINILVWILGIYVRKYAKSNA